MVKVDHISLMFSVALGIAASNSQRENRLWRVAVVERFPIVVEGRDEFLHELDQRRLKPRHVRQHRI